VRVPLEYAMLVIGDRINGTVKTVRQALLERDADFIGRLAASQSGAGADYIDVNAGTGGGEDELELMEWTLCVVAGATDKPVSLDSSDPKVLEKGLELLEGAKPFVNSVSGEAARLESILPLAAVRGCPLIALAMDEEGIPKTAAERVAVCVRIRDRARYHGIPDADLYFDPLVLPISVDHEQGRITLDTIALLKREMPECRTVLGLSNVSFGLPRRTLLNRAMLTACLFLGLDAALLDPTDSELLSCSSAAEAVTARDPFCRRYIKAYRSGLLGRDSEGD
jgi:5-methyltetrahydrofolate--homocysteine methyltransferase